MAETLNVVVMGVSGCGKSTLGALLACRLKLPFLEGDTLHPPENVARMAAGVALTDADRAGWLALLAARLAHARAQGSGLVLSCSALKRAYRDLLRQADPQLRLVYLYGPQALLAGRMAQRQGHYMPASLLGSQLATLEPPQPDEQALALDIGHPPAELVARACAHLAPRTA